MQPKPPVVPPDSAALTRRSLLKGALAAAAPYVITSFSLAGEDRPAPSNRFTMGFVGVGGQGSGDMGGFLGFPEIQGVAVCDVDKAHRDRARDRVNQRYGSQGCEAYNDFRDLVTRRDIDIVFCATPDHWHAIITIEAMKNGKDVYCEKPETLTIREGRAMVQAARRYGRVFSGGSQRVWGDYNWFHRMVRGGAIGEPKECWVNVGGPSDEMLRPAEPVPEGMDWDMWLGPAPQRPYNKDYHPFKWRGCRDFSGGGMTDWGAHGFGGALFCLGLHETGPVEIIPPDGKDTRHLTYVFANGIRIYHGGSWSGLMSYRGTKGEIPERGASERAAKKDAPSINIPNYKGRGGIFGDFVHCVKTRERPFRDIEIAHRTVTVCHLGNIAYWLGRPLKWDPVKEEIVGDAEAARWLDRPKRAPWRI
ncbi:MAG: Gfo/Idh/MocA family oxidoreductase [Planctomycetes bacterium]|nr:Gfo/Idh/MocA family oxidoreductase [Planctomycetota bacterium]